MFRGRSHLFKTPTAISLYIKPANDEDTTLTSETDHNRSTLQVKVARQWKRSRVPIENPPEGVMLFPS